MLAMGSFDVPPVPFWVLDCDTEAGFEEGLPVSLVAQLAGETKIVVMSSVVRKHKKSLSMGECLFTIETPVIAG